MLAYVFEESIISVVLSPMERLGRRMLVYVLEASDVCTVRLEEPSSTWGLPDVAPLPEVVLATAVLLLDETSTQGLPIVHPMADAGEA
jgi:hypothetical protein